MAHREPKKLIRVSPETAHACGILGKIHHVSNADMMDLIMLFYLENNDVKCNKEEIIKAIKLRADRNQVT